MSETDLGVAASVENLHTIIEKLKNENASLKAEVERMQKIVDGCFYRFAKLPLELRNIIWSFALTTPQIHLISKKFTSSSQVNVIMKTCREARSKGLSLRIPYLMAIDPKSRPAVTAGPRIYMNLDVDTIWLYDSPDWHVDLQIHCPRCSSAETLPAKAFPPEESHHLLKRLALSTSAWMNPEENGRNSDPDSAWSARTLLGFNEVQELLIVVGDESTRRTSRPSRNVVFKAPTLAPIHMLEIRMLHNDWRSDHPEDLEIAGWPTSHRDVSWHHMADRQEKILAHFKRKRSIAREHELEVEGVSLEDLNEIDGFEDLQEWKIPKVRYVEALTEETIDQWVPNHNPYV